MEVSRQIFREANRMRNKGGSLTKKSRIGKYVSLDK
jgi:hypothetical protein